MNYRNWLVEKRNSKNLSQIELSVKVGISQQALSKYESGTRTPSVETAKKIAKVLGFNWTKFYE